MLERTLEPEVMDSAEDALEYNRMDHSVVNKKFVDEFLEFLESNQKRLRVASDPAFDDLEDDDIIAGFLDVGTGTALIPVELCHRNPEVRIMAIDLAVSMLDIAIHNVDLAGFRNQIQLAQVDAKDSGFEDEMFDAVVSNSIIHHIPEPEKVVSEIIRTTREGGAIFVRDLMRPQTAADVDSLVETYAGQESDYSRRLFGESLHAALSLDEMRQLVASFGVSGETVTATSDRHWTWATIR
jgi:SAM-dependent methyltransferase